MLQRLLSDFRYAARQFRQSPVFSITAIATLALGIGGTTAIFSLIHAVMLRSLPVADPATLYRLGAGSDCCVEGGPQTHWGVFSYSLLQRIQGASPEFEEIAAFQAASPRSTVRRVRGDLFARSLRSEYVTGNYFDTFGIRPFIGRMISPADDRPNSAAVAVLSYRVWKQTYGGDTSVVGSTFVVEGHPFTIAGVAPPGFFGDTLRSDPPEIWIPLNQEPMIAGEGNLLHQPFSGWLRLIGRLKPGATTAGLNARYTTILRNWLVNDASYPRAWQAEIKRLAPRQSVEVVPGGAGVAEMKEDYQRSLQILLTVCGLVLLISCANVANLLLARGMTRRAQISLRLAIGASRGRIVTQCLVESVLLALIGGLAGLFVADGAGRILLGLAFHGAEYVPIDTDPSLPVLAFAFGLSLVTGLIFGTAPAWFATHMDPADALRGGNRTTRDSSNMPRALLLILQATLSVVLVAGAALLTRSLANLENQNFGIRTQDRVTVQLNSPPAFYTPERLDAVYRQIEDRLRELPGVENVGLALYNPLTDNWGDIIFVDGHPAPRLSDEFVASFDRVSADYFPTVGQPILRGRGFSSSDNVHTAPVAIINETFARRFFPNEDPIGKSIGTTEPANARDYRVVGIAADAKFFTLREPTRPMFFAALAQWSHYDTELMRKFELRSHLIGGVMLHTRATAGELEPVLRRTLNQIDPNLTINSVRTLQTQVGFEFDQERAVAGLAGLFGIVALLLAAVGLYGVTAYAVAQRTSEIGVRMALGAGRGSIMQLVLRGAYQKVGLGLLLGIPLSIGAGRLISSQLYGVVSWDPLALLVAIAALALCAFIAAIVPANRAASIQPIKALRTE